MHFLYHAYHRNQNSVLSAAGALEHAHTRVKMRPAHARPGRSHPPQPSFTATPRPPISSSAP
eukprot:7280623-Prymnesium_polylepis.1